MLALSAVVCGFRKLSGQTNDCQINICCSSATHAAIRSKNKDQLAQNQDTVLKWNNKSTCRLFQ